MLRWFLWRTGDQRIPESPLFWGSRRNMQRTMPRASVLWCYILLSPRVEPTNLITWQLKPEKTCENQCENPLWNHSEVSSEKPDMGMTWPDPVEPAERFVKLSVGQLVEARSTTSNETVGKPVTELFLWELVSHVSFLVFLADFCIFFISWCN